MITIIDYDAGNLKSVEKAFQFLGEQTQVTRDRNVILNADKVVLPGVGAFGVAMEKLHHYDLVETIHEVVAKQTPLLGICLGMQLLFESSEETPGISGLSILEGEIIKLPAKMGYKIPHMGWNSLSITPGAKLYQGITDQSYVYFVHSYYLKAKHMEDVAATTDYITTIHASVERGNVFGCQFHPEKSGDTGLKILKNFAEL